MSRYWLPIIALIGAVCIGLGIYSLVPSSQETPAERKSKSDSVTVRVAANNAAGVMALSIEPEDELEITATGTVNIGRGPVGPDGEANYFDATMDGPFTHNVGGLEMWVGNKGHRYFVGQHIRQKFLEGGDIYFRVVESVYGYGDGNTGEFTVTITKTKASNELRGTIPITKAWTYIGKFKGKVHIAISGSASFHSRLGPLGPEGYSEVASQSYPLPGVNVFCALVKYGNHIEKVGANRDLFFDSDTELYLGPNEENGIEGAGFSDNRGEWNYVISF